jgi:hypothetical protein
MKSRQNNFVVVSAAAIFAVAAGIALAQHSDHEAHPAPHSPSKASTPSAAHSGLTPPSSIQEEHKHLHHQLDAAVAAGGKTGESAKAVAAVLLPHFEEEEAFALPPLGLLPALVDKKPVDKAQARRAIEMADQLRKNYDTMIKEHKELTDALHALAAAATQEGKPEQAHFAEALIAHALNEEQILYPATLLIGEYLKLQHGADGG